MKLTESVVKRLKYRPGKPEPQDRWCDYLVSFGVRCHQDGTKGYLIRSVKSDGTTEVAEFAKFGELPCWQARDLVFGEVAASVLGPVCEALGVFGSAPSQP